MMSELPPDYAEFFRLAFAADPSGKDKDYEPFAYQRQLANLDEPLPSLINVPTGTGKTAAVNGAMVLGRVHLSARVRGCVIFFPAERNLVQATGNNGAAKGKTPLVPKRA